MAVGFAGIVVWRSGEVVEGFWRWWRAALGWLMVVLGRGVGGHVVVVWWWLLEPWVVDGGGVKVAGCSWVSAENRGEGEERWGLWGGAPVVLGG